MPCWPIASGRGSRPSGTRSRYFTLTHRIPRAGSAVADVPRGGRRDRPVLPGQAADWARPRRPDAHLSVPRDAGRADRLPRRFSSGTPSCFGRCRRGRVRLLVPRHKTDADPARIRRPFASSSASPLRPAVVEDLRWYFHARRARADEARTSASTRRRGPSARHGFRRCIGRGSKRGEPVLDATLSPTLADADRPRDGPVGVSCSAASLRASASPRRHGLIGRGRGRRGGRRPRAGSSAHGRSAPGWAAPLATRITTSRRVRR